MNSPIAGFLAGCAATLPMSALMHVLHARLPAREAAPLPPDQITEAIVERAGLNSLEKTELRAATVASHFAYGAACGTIYSQVESRVEAPPVAKGIAFGLVVWLASYLGWLPISGIAGAANKQSARRNGLMIGAHIVWGAATGALFHAWNNDNS